MVSALDALILANQHPPIFFQGDDSIFDEEVEEIDDENHYQAVGDLYNEFYGAPIYDVYDEADPIFRLCDSDGANQICHDRDDANPIFDVYDEEYIKFLGIQRKEDVKLGPAEYVQYHRQINGQPPDREPPDHYQRDNPFHLKKKNLYHKVYGDPFIGVNRDDPIGTVCNDEFTVKGYDDSSKCDKIQVTNEKLRLVSLMSTHVHTSDFGLGYTNFVTMSGVDVLVLDHSIVDRGSSRESPFCSSYIFHIGFDGSGFQLILAWLILDDFDVGRYVRHELVSQWLHSRTRWDSSICWLVLKVVIDFSDAVLINGAFSRISYLHYYQFLRSTQRESLSVEPDKDFLLHDMKSYVDTSGNLANVNTICSTCFVEHTNTLKDLLILAAMLNVPYLLHLRMFGLMHDYICFGGKWKHKIIVKWVFLMRSVVFSVEFSIHSDIGEAPLVKVPQTTCLFSLFWFLMSQGAATMASKEELKFLWPPWNPKAFGLLLFTSTIMPIVFFPTVLWLCGLQCGNLTWKMAVLCHTIWVYQDTSNTYIQWREVICQSPKLLFYDSSVFHVCCNTSILLLPPCNGLSIITWELIKQIVALQATWQENLYVLATVDLFGNIMRYTCVEWDLNCEDVTSYDHCLFLELFDLKLTEVWSSHYSLPYSSHHGFQLEYLVVDDMVICWKEFSFKRPLWDQNMMFSLPPRFTTVQWRFFFLTPLRRGFYYDVYNRVYGAMRTTRFRLSYDIARGLRRVDVAFGSHEYDIHVSDQTNNMHLLAWIISVNVEVCSYIWHSLVTKWFRHWMRPCSCIRRLVLKILGKLSFGDLQELLFCSTRPSQYQLPYEASLKRKSNVHISPVGFSYDVTKVHSKEALHLSLIEVLEQSAFSNVDKGCIRDQPKPIWVVLWCFVADFAPSKLGFIVFVIVKDLSCESRSWSSLLTFLQLLVEYTVLVSKMRIGVHFPTLNVPSYVTIRGRIFSYPGGPDAAHLHSIMSP
ncbi:unnamed protein product [Microthlaspi erraticum]|uniref:Uncharacterized protein n=1 Tax=Microthlaspi erraticum TaxID=1685480 RepID=A0A6D2JB20_9BRAS|nr:unnamed protein product [Microthlaspi erraticum]CAA7034230.1 unnamed protein product [Microthlaspi erraticum]CAA7044031.1 unnamed protein product [Microthlaspi erraticum]CAA7044032.1 unnamed protein product [Microthlaspi erraticum]